MALSVGIVVTLSGTKTTANQPIKAVCLSNNGSTAVMQSYGFGNGAWPGSGTLSASSYGTSTGNFSISNICMPTGTSTSNLVANYVSNQSEAILTALKTAAGSYSSFGASGRSAWLGTPLGDSSAYVVQWNGIVEYYNNRSFGYVVAPAFNLALSGVKCNMTDMYLYV